MGAVSPAHPLTFLCCCFEKLLKEHEICMNFSKFKTIDTKNHTKTSLIFKLEAVDLLGVEGFRSGQTDQEQTCPES